jgi:hypothetical protein
MYTTTTAPHSVCVCTPFIIQQIMSCRTLKDRVAYNYDNHDQATFALTSFSFLFLNGRSLHNCRTPFVHSSTSYLAACYIQNHIIVHYTAYCYTPPSHSKVQSLESRVWDLDSLGAMPIRHPPTARLPAPRLPSFLSILSVSGTGTGVGTNTTPWANDVLIELEKTACKADDAHGTQHIENISLSRNLAFGADLERGLPRDPNSTQHKPARRFWIWRRGWGRPSAYKVLFTLILLTNLALLLFTLSTRHLVPSTAMLAVSSNLFLALLIRNEHLTNTLFFILSRLAMHAPPMLKKHLADFHHYGGVHSSCALSAVLWYLQYTALRTMALVYLVQLRDSAKEYGSAWRLLMEIGGWEYVDVGLCYFILLILLLVCVTAMPGRRRRWHNLFERVHRFGGWAAILALWVHVVGQSFATRKNVVVEVIEGAGIVPLWKTASFYLLLGTTLLVIHPWLYVRRIRVYPQNQRVGRSTSGLLPHYRYQYQHPLHLGLGAPGPSRYDAATLIFPYRDMPATSTMRFSTSPLTEWHSFATIPSSSSLPAAKVIVARAGDWTTSIIRDPPTHLWVRKLPAKNFLAFARCWDRVLVVATGAGIGPIVSFLGSVERNRETEKLVKVLWCARNPFSAEWEDVRRAIDRVDSTPWILESKSNSEYSGRSGSRNRRPDLLEESKAVAREYGIQACFVVGNKTVTDMIVGGLKRVGVPAYGAVFDS